MHTYCTLGITNKDGVRLAEFFLNLLQVQVREESCEGLGEAVHILLYLLGGRIEKGV